MVETTGWAICPNIPSRGFTLLAAPAPTTVSSNAPALGHTETLPIEVLGPPGTVESFHLPLLTNAPSITAIYLQVHNLSFEGKMSFRLNENPWRTLTDDNVIYPRLEAGFFGIHHRQMKGDIFRSRRASCARGPAIDAAGLDRIKEAAIGAGIACQDLSPAGIFRDHLSSLPS